MLHQAARPKGGHGSLPLELLQLRLQGHNRYGLRCQHWQCRPAKQASPKTQRTRGRRRNSGLGSQKNVRSNVDCSPNVYAPILKRDNRHANELPVRMRSRALPQGTGLPVGCPGDPVNRRLSNSAGFVDGQVEVDQGKLYFQVLVSLLMSSGCWCREHIGRQVLVIFG
jgi:hypothetical protein